MRRLECLALSVLFACSPAWADTVTLKNGKALKGLVVERHADRILFSTVKGEIPILLSGIRKIDYDDPALSYLHVGRQYEEKNKLGEALAYYEKAAEINPALTEAQRRIQSVRNRFWMQSSSKPLDEIAGRQAIYDLWEAGGSQSAPAADSNEQRARQAQMLRDGLGIEIEKKGDWTYISSVQKKKDGWIAGLRRKDRLAAVDGSSLRYLSAPAVERMLLEPAHTTCILDYERVISIGGGSDPGKQGITLKQTERGLEVARLAEASVAADAGVEEGDMIVAVGEQATRYLPIGKVKKMIKDSKSQTVELTVRRSAILTRR